MQRAASPTLAIDLQSYPYASRRMPVLAAGGVVATSQPLAAQAGLDVLRDGGSAVDAAIATAVALTVLEPTSNGIGSDAFAMVWDGTELQGLNSSGRAPAGLSLDALDAAGLAELPSLGWWPVTVPGAPRAWAELHARFGRLELARVLAPAISYAENGFPVSPVVARAWAAGYRAYSRAGDPVLAHWFATFCPSGQPPRAGEIVRLPHHAETLRRLARFGPGDLYSGEIAERIDAFARSSGGTLRGADLAAHSADWVAPLRMRYRGFDVCELPPNGQGIAALIALGILEGVSLEDAPRDDGRSLHRQIEALKLGLSDAIRHVGDPSAMSAKPAELLAPERLRDLRESIQERALDPSTPAASRGGTVYLCAADADGRMVSFIQSNYQGFGSGVVVPGTGIALHNRGLNFTLEPGHPNQLGPGKRPYHTIIPAFLMRGEQPVGPFGVMGAFMQAQGHVQVMVNTLAYGMNPQAALDAPRWRWEGGRLVVVEPDLAPEAIEDLRARGHEVVVDEEPAGFGRGQAIWRLDSGAYCAGSDKRADGAAVGY